MKKTLIIAITLLLTIPAIAQKASLSGTVEGLPQGVNIVVCKAEGGRLIPNDTISLDSKGHFKLEYSGISEPLFFALMLSQPRSPMLHVILLPKEKVAMNFAYDSVINALQINSVKGSDNMEVYRKFNNFMVNASKDASLQGQLADNVEKLISDNSTILMSAFIVTYFESAFEQYATLYKKVRDALIGKYAGNDFVRHLDDKVRTAIIVGMEAPDIVMAGRDGLTRRLSDLRGKVVLIDFWASWCRPCRMENPNVVRIYKQYHDQGFDIFSVSLDNSREKWLEAIEADGLIWENHVSDLHGWSSSGGKLYGINSIPATVLIDREGNVVARNLRGQELENKVKEILSR